MWVEHLHCGCGLSFVYGLFVNFIMTYIKAGMYMYVHEEHLYLNLLSLPFFFIPSFPSLPPSLPPSLSASFSLPPPFLRSQIFLFSGRHYFIKATISHAFKLLPNFQSQCSLLLFHVVLCLCASGEGEEGVLCE